MSRNARSCTSASAEASTQSETVLDKVGAGVIFPEAGKKPRGVHREQNLKRGIDTEKLRGGWDEQYLLKVLR